MNFIKLPNGDYLNLNNIEKVKFTSPEDTEQVKHLVAQVDYHVDVDHYRDNDAIFIKDYLDKYYGSFFLIHELDYAVQSVGLGCAVQIISDMYSKPMEEISQMIVNLANETVSKLSLAQITLIREDYEKKHGNGQAGSLGFVPLSK